TPPLYADPYTLSLHDALPISGAGIEAGLAAYTAARLPRTRMVANGSYRASRLSGMTSRPAIALRNAGISLAGRLAPGLMIRQMRSEEHTSELQSPYDLVCRLL